MLRPDHPRDRELLMALDGELSQRRQAIVNGHVSACQACQARLDQMRTRLAEASGIYRSAFGQPPSPFPSTRPRLEHALRQAADDWDRSWLVRLRNALVAVSGTTVHVGIAGVAVLVAVLWMSRAGDMLHLPSPGSDAPLPIAALTPGAVAHLTSMELCAGTRPSRLVTAESREQVLRDYGMQKVSTGAYELDALITPELGGTTAPENLWPQRYAAPVWNARVKDELEQLLPRLVCSNEVALVQAQREIATDWVAAYKRYFRTDMPLQAHLGAPLGDDDDLEFAGTWQVAQHSAPTALSVRFVRR